jgi:hypothetical protein
MLEPPQMFVKTDDALSALGALYFRGREIPDSSRGLRRLFETIAGEIAAGLAATDVQRIVHELPELRERYADAVVYNEPELWLRTVWHEADLLFHYVLAKHDYRLFGAFIFYPDLDEDFADYVERNAEAIGAMTADDALLFAFNGADPSTILGAGSEYIAYRSVIEAAYRHQ